MDVYQVISAIFDNIGVPVLGALGVLLVYVINSFGKKITSSIIAKNEAESLEKTFSVKSYVIQQISTIVDAAVASNMQIADEMKKAGQKLDEDQIAQLNNSAKELVLNSLPASLTEESGSMLQVIGGQDKLDALITALMEKSVYEYKLRKVAAKKEGTTPEALLDKKIDEVNANTTYSIKPTQLYKRNK